MFRIPEEFHSAGNLRGDYLEIFVNPSKREMKELDDHSSRNGVRFIADNQTKKVYAFSSSFIHMDAAEILFPSGGIDVLEDLEKKGQAFSGFARKEGNVYKCVGADFIGHHGDKYFDTIISTDWSWVDRYILLSPFIDKIATTK